MEMYTYKAMVVMSIPKLIHTLVERSIIYGTIVLIESNTYTPINNESTATASSRVKQIQSQVA